MNFVFTVCPHRFWPDVLISVQKSFFHIILYGGKHNVVWLQIEAARYQHKTNTTGEMQIIKRQLSLPGFTIFSFKKPIPV